MSGKKKRNDEDDFFVTQKWMRKLHYLDDKCEEKELNGNVLSVYAIIYGYSKNGKGLYRGGYKYLADWIGVTPGTAQVLVKKLVSSGLLQEIKSAKGGVIYNHYIAIRPSENHTPTKIVPLRNSCSDPSENRISTPTKIVPNNIIGRNMGESIYQRGALKTDGLMDSETDFEETRERFREQLELDTLALRYDSDMLEEILENIVEMYCCPNFTQKIGQYPQTTKGVRLQLDKLEAKHIEYLMESMASTTQPIKNPKAYLQTAILNARSTFEHHCQFGANAIMANAPCRPSPEFALTAEEIHRRMKKRGDGA